MKIGYCVKRAFGGLFAATTLAVIALQGGVAQTENGVVNSAGLLVWRNQEGTAGRAASADYDAWQSQLGRTADSSAGDPEFKYISVRRY